MSAMEYCFCMTLQPFRSNLSVEERIKLRTPLVLVPVADVGLMLGPGPGPDSGPGPGLGPGPGSGSGPGPGTGTCCRVIGVDETGKIKMGYEGQSRSEEGQLIKM